MGGVEGLVPLKVLVTPTHDLRGILRGGVTRQGALNRTRLQGTHPILVQITPS